MMNFIPNACRVVNVAREGPCCEGSPSQRYPTPCPKPVDDASGALILPPKSNADVLDYTVNFKDWFADTGDSIASSDVKGLNKQCGGTPLTVIEKYNVAEAVTVVLGGGAPKQKYTFTVEITTRQGLVFGAPVSLQITDTPADYPPVIIQYNLPDDLTRDGPVFIAGDAYVTGGKPMPNGLYLIGDSPVVLTTGCILYRNTVNNGGLLMAEGETQ